MSPVILADPRKWSFAQALIVSLLSGVVFLLVITLAGCGCAVRAYRRASRHVRRLIVRSLPSLADDIEMATVPSAKVNSTGAADSAKKENTAKGGSGRRKVQYRRSEKKK